MKKKITVGFVLALALIFFGCSTDGGKQNTYYGSTYGIKDCTEFSAMISSFSANKPYISDDINLSGASFNDVKDLWSRISQLNGSEFEGSETGETESSLKDELTQHNITSKEANEMIKSLNTRGNAIWGFNSAVAKYCFILLYLEKE